MKYNLFLFFLLSSIYNFIYSDSQLSQSTLIWNTGLALEAQIRPSSFKQLFPKIGSYFYPEKIQAGDIVWIQPDQVDTFIRTYLHRITQPIILLINTCDATFPDCLSSKTHFDFLIQSKLISHIFCQNCSVSNHPKITQIPIGLDLHTLAYGKKFFGEGFNTVSEQEDTLLSLRELSLSSTKKLIACGDFHFNDSMRFKNQLYKVFGEDRTSIYNRLKESPYTYFFPERLPRRALWLEKTQYAFSLCPPGNGIDTHRLWEDMILGLIPIVKTSPLDPLYRQFPIVIVKDWGEVTEANLKKWHELYKDEIRSQSTFEKLKQSYWLNKILKIREPLLGSP